MDAVGAASAIIAVLQITAFVINTTTQYIRSAKSANKAANVLRRELKTFRAILEELEERAEDEKASGGDLAEMSFLKTVEEPLVECKALLQKLQNKLAASDEANGLKNSLLWPFREKEIENAILAVHRFKETFHLALSLDNSALVKDIWSDVKDISITQKGNVRLTIIQRLEVVDTSTNHILAQKKRQERTGEWFLEGKSFRTWRGTRSAFLWLHGIPGCGKTILSSSIIEHLRDRVADAKKSCLALAYFYFDYNDPANRNATSFLSCIVGQLCRNLDRLPTSVQDLYASDASREKQTKPTLDMLFNALGEILDNWSHVYLVIDALDECDLEKREEVLTLLVNLSSLAGDIRILVTSRRETDIEQVMQKAAHQIIEMQSNKVDADISLYVQYVLQTDPKMKKWSLSDKQKVKETLVQKAAGMFRWVFCQLETLRKCMNRTAIHRTLESLPKTLDRTYERIILGIEEEYCYQAIIALHWLSCTRRPLKLRELAEAVAVEASIDDSYSFNSEERLFRPSLILEICSSLVSVSGVEESADVRLAHFTVQEYLLSDRIQSGPAAAFRVTLTKGNAIMAAFCVSYMHQLSDGSEEDEQSRTDSESEGFSDRAHSTHARDPSADEDPLLRYAAEYWYQHANSFTQHSPELSTMILQLLGHNPDGFGVMDWWKYVARYRLGIWYEFPDLRVLGGSVGVAAYLGLLPEVKLLLELDLGDAAANRDLGTALHAAAYGGNLDIVEMVLEKGGDPNASGGLFGNPLQASAYYGELSIISRLLEAGAEPNLEGGKYGTALQTAAHRGNREACELLLANGCDPNVGIGAGPYGSPLQAAAYHVDEKMVKLLLDKGADPNADGGKYGSALQAAAYRSARDIVKLLLESGANPNVEGGEYGTALQAATFWGNTDIVSLLLDHGANPNAQQGTFQYGTALQAAANWGTLDIVELLLERGADPNIEAGNYGTALEAAVYRKDRQMCKVLLDNGAKPSVESGEYGALLNKAALQGNDLVIDLLFDEKRDPSAETGCYGKAVQLAALKGYKDAVKMMKIEDGAASLEGLSPRHYATLKLRQNLAQIIPEPDLDQKHNYSSPFTCLHWAAWFNHGPVVDFVFKEHAEQGGDISGDVQNEDVEDLPSKVATSQVQSIALPQILETKAAGAEDWSPLHLAIFRRHIGAVEALISQQELNNALGGPVSLQRATVRILNGQGEGDSPTTELGDDLRWTRIHVAALLGKEALIEHWSDTASDFDVDAQDVNGMTALHWTAAAGRRRTVELLLSKSADPDVRDDWGRKPADLAAGGERLALLDMLTGGRASDFPPRTILSQGVNCACWRTCDFCNVLLRHGDLFMHCEPCNDLDLCEKCLLQDRGCKESSHSPELWNLHGRMASLTRQLKSVGDVLTSRAIPRRLSVNSALGSEHQPSI